MDAIIELLSGPLGVLIGVIVGAGLTFAGSALTAKASRQAARETADASVAVATAQRLSERRMRMDELTYRDRRALVEELLIIMERELETGGVDDEMAKAASLHPKRFPEGAMVVNKMGMVFPEAVTNAARSVAAATIGAADARANLALYENADPIHKKLAELAWTESVLARSKGLSEFLAAVQEAMTRLDGDAK